MSNLTRSEILSARQRRQRKWRNPKIKTHEEISKDIEEFLAQGNTIYQAAPGESGNKEFRK